MKNRIFLLIVVVSFLGCEKDCLTNKRLNDKINSCYSDSFTQTVTQRTMGGEVSVTFTNNCSDYVMKVSKVNFGYRANYGVSDTEYTNISDNFIVPPNRSVLRTYSLGALRTVTSVEADHTTLQFCKDENRSRKKKTRSGNSENAITIPYSNNSPLKFWEEKSSNSRRIGSVPMGEEVKLLSQENGWAEIEYNNQRGYVRNPDNRNLKIIESDSIFKKASSWFLGLHLFWKLFIISTAVFALSGIFEDVVKGANRKVE